VRYGQVALEVGTVGLGRDQRAYDLETLLEEPVISDNYFCRQE
jgi:hypothetical protein